MTHQSPVHPHPQQLTEFALGTLSPDLAEDISKHVADCEECRQTVKDVPDDSFVTLVRVCDIVPIADKSVTEEHNDSLGFSASAYKEQPSQPSDMPTIDPSSSPTPPAPSEIATIDPTMGLGDIGSNSGSMNTFNPDQNLIDHPTYNIIDQIGQGGMGAVYKAEHRVMRRQVALKVINNEFVSNEAAVNRFRREVQAAAQLHHPNIVTAHDAGQAGDVHFLVMEYVEGKDLETILRNKGPLPIQATCFFMRQVALGLQHAHEKGMVHRDIKPQNLMLTRKAVVKILDFGLVSLTGDDTPDGEVESEDGKDTALTQQGTIMGTPDFMSPEQAGNARTVDIRSDIYSMGCTMYRLLTGEVPFPEKSAMDKILAHVSKRAKPIRELRPEVPEKLERVIMKMMAKDPSKRFQTPAEVARYLTPFADNKPKPKASATNKPTPAKETAKVAVAPETKPVRKRRWPLVATMVGSLAALLFAVAGIVFYLQTRHGTVRVEINDPNIKVKLEQLADGSERIIADNNGDPIKITPGKHKLHIEYGKRKFSTTEFELGWGENPPLKVTFLNGKLVATNGKNLRWEREGVALAENTDFSLIRSFQGHTGPAKSLAYSSDGRYIASGSGYKVGDKTARVWNAETGKLLHTFPHSTQVLTVAFSPNNKTLITGTAGGILTLRDVNSGRLVRTLVDNLGYANNVVFSPDGEVVYARRQFSKAIYGFSIKTGKQVSEMKGPEDDILDLEITGDGRHILAASRNSRICVWNNAGTLLRCFPEQGSTNHASVGMALLPGGRVLLGDGQGTLRLANWQTGQTIRTVHVDMGVQNITTSSDGKFAYLAGNISSLEGQEGIAIVDLQTFKTTYRKTGKLGMTWDVVLSPDGKNLVSAGGSYWHKGGLKKTGDYALRLWQLPESMWPKETTKDEITLVREFEGHSDIVRAVCYLPDGKHVLSVSRDDNLRKWEMQTGKGVSRLMIDGYFAAAAFSADGRLVAVGSNSGQQDLLIEVWDVQNKKKLYSYKADFQWITRLTISPDGHYLAAGGNPGQVILWDLRTGKEIHKLDMRCRIVTEIEFSPDGKTLACDGRSPERLTLWDIETGKQSQEFTLPNKYPLFSLRFSSDGKLILAGQSAGTLRLFDVGKKDPVKSFRPAEGGVIQAHFLNGNRFVLIAAGNNDKALRLLDLETGLVLATTVLGKDVISHISISPDGRYAVSGSGETWNEKTGQHEGIGDYTLRLWRLPERVWPKAAAIPKVPIPDGPVEMIRKYSGHETGNPGKTAATAVAFSPNGLLLASGGEDGQMRIRELATGKVLHRIKATDNINWRALSFSSDSTRLLSGSTDLLQIWDVKTGQLVKRLFVVGRIQEPFSYRMASEFAVL